MVEVSLLELFFFKNFENIFKIQKKLQLKLLSWAFSFFVFILQKLTCSYVDFSEICLWLLITAFGVSGWGLRLGKIEVLRWVTRVCCLGDLWRIMTCQQYVWASNHNFLDYLWLLLFDCMSGWGLGLGKIETPAWVTRVCCLGNLQRTITW